MKDLDFDELDRAVNSLMTDVAKNQPQSAPEGDKEKTLDITPTLDADATPSFATLEKETAKTSSAAPASKTPVTPQPSSAPLAARRGGRFMDVVHPSSDMKTATTVPSRPVSRSGVTVEPRANLVSAPVETASAKPEASEETVPISPPAPVEQTAPTDDWPDPLEVANFKEDTHNEPAADQKLLTPMSVDESESPAVPDEEPAPLVSPFLPGTKVEKRPLGAAASSVEEPDHAPVLGSGADAFITSDDQTAQLPASPNDVATQMPEELQSDLIAIEADTNSPWDVPETSAKETSEQPAKKQEEADKKPEKEAPEPMPLPKEPKEVRQEPASPSGPTSIPQQYQEETNTGDQQSGAIYDTDAYHQPLAHPGKKKSGWLWVVWIVLILLIGAGGGAALYFLGIV